MSLCTLALWFPAAATDPALLFNACLSVRAHREKLSVHQVTHVTVSSTRA